MKVIAVIEVEDNLQLEEVATWFASALSTSEVTVYSHKEASELWKNGEPEFLELMDEMLG